MSSARPGPTRTPTRAQGNRGFRASESGKSDPLHTLREKAAAARAKADEDREARRRRLHAQRCVRRWNDPDGMANLTLRLPGEDMAEIDAALKPRIDRAFADARNAGQMERVEAYTADVVRTLLLGAASPDTPARRSQAVRPEKKVIALIDLAALNRGMVEPGRPARSPASGRCRSPPSGHCCPMHS